jgi:hypothetical protein
MSQSDLFVPVVAPLLRHRKLMLVITGAVALQIALTGLHLPGRQCPIFQFLGIPCPGCGLTRATIFLLEGDWRRAFTFHAFAPVFVIAFALISGTALSPQAPREKVINLTDNIERRTGVAVIFLLGLIIYWLARLIIMQSDFVKLIQG